jgi:hypothetical protein
MVFPGENCYMDFILVFLLNIFCENTVTSWIIYVLPS